MKPEDYEITRHESVFLPTASSNFGVSQVLRIRLVFRYYSTPETSSEKVLDNL